MSIRLPRLLDADGHEAARLSPISLSLQLRLNPLSTAEMTLPCNAPDIRLRDLLELYDEHGSAGFFRVTEVQEKVGDVRLVRLEHSLCTLRDSMAESFAFTGSVRDALSALLACQVNSRWTLGDVELSDDVLLIFAVEYTDLLTALTRMLSMLPEGYALFFDQTADSWRLHLRRLSAHDACEGRLTRNLQSVSCTQDSSTLCTRVYPFGAETAAQPVTLTPLEGRTYLQSEATAQWGVISRQIQSELIYDASTLRSVAQAYLERHAQPDVTISLTGIDLSEATGEPMDAFRLGQICRLALPDFGMTLRQRITAIEKPDLYGSPGLLKLTLTSRRPSGSLQSEIDDLVRQVTSARLLGGTITEVVDENRAYGSYPSPVLHYFDVGDWAAVLDVRVTFEPDSGVSVNALLVDGVELSVEERRSGSFSAMPYLRRDALGQIAPGEHWVTFHPSNGTYGEDCGVSSTVTMTVITNQTT